MESLEEYLKQPSRNPPTKALATVDPPSSNPSNSNIAAQQANPSIEAAQKKDAIDFFASLDDELAMQNYQQPIPNIRIGSPSVAGSFSSSNPFAPAMAQRSVSPFDSFNLQTPNQPSLSNFQPNFPAPNQPSFNSFHPAPQASQQHMLNPFSQTAPSSFAHPSSFPGAQGSNPFAQTQVQQSRNTNPFGASGFASHGPQPSNFGFPQFTNQAAPQNPPHNDLSNLFSQHTFPTQ